MIYTPQRNPRNAMLLITFIAAAGILGSIWISKLFAVAALIFWIQYTAVLSYKQFAKKRKYKIKDVATFLLNPQFRFFIFVFIATIGIFSVFYMNELIAYACIITWWLFSLNFYVYYNRKKS